MQEKGKPNYHHIKARFLSDSAQHLVFPDGGESSFRGVLGVIRTKHAHTLPEVNEYFAMARTVAATDPYQARQYLRMVMLYCTWPRRDLPIGYENLRAEVESDIASRLPVSSPVLPRL